MIVLGKNSFSVDFIYLKIFLGINSSGKFMYYRSTTKGHPLKINSNLDNQIDPSQSKSI